MTDRKKPTAGSWMTVALVAALVAYPLTFGPACWLCGRDPIPPAVDQAIAYVYGPLADRAILGKNSIDKVLWRWSKCFRGNGAFAFYVRGVS